MQEWFIDVTRLSQKEIVEKDVVKEVVKEVADAYRSFSETHRPHAIFVNVVTSAGILIATRLRAQGFPVRDCEITHCNGKRYQHSLLREQVFPLSLFPMQFWV